MNGQVLALVALGSNLGDRLGHVQAGLKGLEALEDTEVVAISGLYETAPVGGPDGQGAYLNAVAMIRTGLSAEQVLAGLHSIEQSQHRERRVHWGARTLDLDLLVHGEFVSSGEKLTVPHPRMQDRRFVMVPVCDVAPELVHPVLERSMSELLDDLVPEPGDLTLVAQNWRDLETVDAG